MIFVRDPSNPFNGIFSFLRQNEPSDVFENTIISSPSGTLEGRGQPIIVFDPFVTGNTNADNWHSLNVVNSSISVSFLCYFVSLSEYSLRSRNDHHNYFPVEWIIEGSIDFILWTVVHHQPHNDDINGRNKSSSFQTTNKAYFRSFRITQLGGNNNADNSYSFILNKAEFFGRVIKSDLYSSVKCYLDFNTIHQTFISIICIFFTDFSK